jgi:flagellar biosynthesis protein FlhG
MEDQAEKLRALARQVKAHKSQVGVQMPASAHTVESVARVLAVTSGKGGVGKSNLSVNLALALCQRGKRVILLDADLGLANADLLLGLSPRFNLHHLVMGLKPLHEIITEGPLGLKVIASGSGVVQLANLSSQQRERIISSFSLIEDQADFILVDTGAGISRNVLSFVLAADEVVVVTTPEPTARLDAYGLIKVVSQENINARLFLVVNQVQDDAEGDEVGELMRTLALRFLNMRLEYLGCVHRDNCVTKAVREGQPFILGHPQSAASRGVVALAGKLLAGGREDQVDSGFKSFLSKVAAFFPKGY